MVALTTGYGDVSNATGDIKINVTSGTEEATYVLHYTREDKLSDTALDREYDYTGEIQEFTAPVEGDYKLETWGAEGGYAYRPLALRGGYGAYATGIIHLRQGETIYIVVGGKGNNTEKSATADTPGGYNGGGNAYHYKSNNTYSQLYSSGLCILITRMVA